LLMISNVCFYIINVYSYGRLLLPFFGLDFHLKKFLEICA
jgi:hypothetical protein